MGFLASAPVEITHHRGWRRTRTSLAQQTKALLTQAIRTPRSRTLSHVFLDWTLLKTWLSLALSLPLPFIELDFLPILGGAGAAVDNEG